jgi:CubicO group peptidase (beta-lactamase class C family)
VGELDWPVARGGAAAVSGSGAELSWRPGTGPDDEFPVASVTKLLTTLAALAAVDAGHLGLDDLASVADQPVEGAREATGVTVRHLLAHASGLPAGLVDHPGGRVRPPGQRRIYSNLGFRALADVVADAVGTSFESWLGSAVLDPLDLAAIRMDARHGHDADPAAGAVSTLPDLVRLARCLLERGAPVVGPELFAEATSVQFPGLAGAVPGVGRFDPNDWGLGFELHDGKRPHWMGDRRSPAAFGHFGATGCFVWVDPVAEVAAAAVTERSVDDGWFMKVWPEWSDRLPGGSW